MGVMSCYRKGCDNIMCDLYSFSYGYICRECFNELMESDMQIKEFMESDKTEVTEKMKYKEIRKEQIKQEFKSQNDGE